MGTVREELGSFGSELIKRRLARRTVLTCSNMMLTQWQASQHREIGKWQAEKILLFFPERNQTGFSLPGFPKTVFWILAYDKTFYDLSTEEINIQENLLNQKSKSLHYMF